MASKTAVAGLNLPLTEMAMGYFRSRALAAAARLGVADALGDAERSIEDLAQACSADQGALYRLLRALASFGIVSEVSPGRFRLSAAGRPLRKDAPQSEWPSVVFWADLLADSWACMTECIRTGDRAGVVKPELSARWREDPEAPAIFRAVMGTSPAVGYMPIAQAWDFGRFQTIADLGGGGGALIEAILQAYPATRGMLVDHEVSIADARARFAGNERCELIATDLLAGVPPGADVYVLKHVLHGYTDDQAAVILERCHAALPPGGRVLVIEFVVPDAVTGADPALEQRLMSDLNMLAVTGGKERSEREWRALLERSGLECVAVHPVAEDLVSIVEGRAPAG